MKTKTIFIKSLIINYFNNFLSNYLYFQQNEGKSSSFFTSFLMCMTVPVMRSSRLIVALPVHSRSYVEASGGAVKLLGVFSWASLGTWLWQKKHESCAIYEHKYSSFVPLHGVYRSNWKGSFTAVSIPWKKGLKLYWSVSGNIMLSFI